MSAAGQKKMWGGRFDRAPDRAFYEFERSFGFDRRLLPFELQLDRAWARAIEKIGILSAGERDKIVTALDQIGKRAASEPAWLDASPAEDVHHFVESALADSLGPLGMKLHTGRSRNEMVATEFRLFVRQAAATAESAVLALCRALARQARTNFGFPLPGMTHLQHAQPILLSHWLTAHAEAFLRDAERLCAAASAADYCPLGAGALAGSAFPVDRAALARELGFARTTRNSLDAVSDRDFAVGYLFALALLAIHLSRLGEDIILYASAEFSFVILPDEFSTGSSLMPQKKNPDAWELIRGKSGRIVGALISLFVTLKALPSSYQRDLQEDKEALFGAHDQALAMLMIAAEAIAATRFDEARLRRAVADPALLATEVADYLAAKGIPFREAHETVGKLIRDAEREEKNFSEFPLERLKQYSPVFAADFAEALTVEASLFRRNVLGGTGAEAVRKALDKLEEELAAREKQP